MGVDPERRWRDPQQFFFYFQHGFPRRQTGAIADAKYVRIDGNGGLAEGCVEDDIRCFAPDAGQCFKGFPTVGDVAVVLFDQDVQVSITFLALLRY